MRKKKKKKKKKVLDDLKENRGQWKFKEEAPFALSGEFSLEEAMDLSHDRKENE